MTRLSMSTQISSSRRLDEDVDMAVAIAALAWTYKKSVGVRPSLACQNSLLFEVPVSNQTFPTRHSRFS